MTNSNYMDFINLNRWKMKVMNHFVLNAPRPKPKKRSSYNQKYL